jgi:citrate lyase subunit beta/citryl-CoA lyase
VTSQPFRGYLYVPAHHPDRIDKAYASIADAIVLDLEDAVPSDHKDKARSVAADVLSGTPPKPTFVRVNSLASKRCLDDVRAVAGPGLSGVRLPKVEHADDVRQVSALLDVLESTAEIQLIVESAHGLEMAYLLATASPRVGLLGLGETDLATDLRASANEATLDAARTRCVIISRAARLPSPVQSVFPEVRDLAGLFASTLRGKEMGFLGRFAIHPSQLSIIHDVFTPSEEEIAEAQEVADAATRAEEDGSSIVITENGRTVGPPAVANARLVLDLARNLRLGVTS